jgi:DNA-binding NtrC family response regulator
MITLPPLRERLDDIRFFAHRFVSEACAELNKQIKDISEDAIACLTNHSWPGNIRELKNVIRRAVLLAGSDVIDQEHVDILMSDQHQEQPVTASSRMKDAVKHLEKKMIQDALEKTKGNKTRAADLLDISYRTLFEKIREYGIE